MGCLKTTKKTLLLSAFPLLRLTSATSSQPTSVDARKIGKLICQLAISSTGPGTLPAIHSCSNHRCKNKLFRDIARLTVDLRGNTSEETQITRMFSPMDSTVNSTGSSSASADYRKKRIKNVQKLELVRLMKANFLFIRGKHAVARSEKSRADVWKVITGRLNSLGPPIQSAEAWQRRWNDMRSATKSKMTKIQNYVREHGEDCPYKLNLVERLIWDTFSVKPEEYMKDLNLKLWREKQQPRVDGSVGPQPQSAVDSVSSCSSQMSAAEQNFDMGWNQGEQFAGGSESNGGRILFHL
ncbi:uncharacterized protein LOC118505218 isoform X2 [Anopheles stephensi]|uniref:uncharacterized protein LOC118505218 isoform X2 n=1 Tax=Anopheles stephensi TaxID=30069 RepID=UPI0016587CD7|nr:uncharacterized protein LOC118505218 isoform X2 [Anopheles stephensi]